MDVGEVLEQLILTDKPTHSKRFAKFMALTLRLLRHSRKSPYWEVIQVHINRGYSGHSHSYDIDTNNSYHIKSKVIYPKKHLNNFKSLSPTQMKLYRDTINTIQQFLTDSKIPADSPIDLSLVLGLNSEFNHDIQLTEKQFNEIKRWIQKMPNIHLVKNVNYQSEDLLICKDHHIETIDFVSNNNYPMITWKNQLKFKTNYKDRRHPENTVNQIKELIKYYQLHTVFNNHSVESKLIISRGLNHELLNAYNNLINNNIYHLKMSDYHHLLGNLGLNILSHFNKILLHDTKELNNLHFDLINNKLTSIQDIKDKYNNALDVDRYGILLQFLIEYYGLYFANRREYENVINGETQKTSNLNVMPFLFEMKTLVKIGKMLDYINTYYNRLIYDPKINKINDVDDGYYFNIHYNVMKNKNMNKNISNKLIHNKKYHVFSEKQLENGECLFSVERCTPDIVLSEPVWINNKPIYWFDAKCTKATNCVYDTKRQYQMYRFTKNYGSGAILALGTADLSIVGINDVQILDCSHYL